MSHESKDNRTATKSPNVRNLKRKASQSKPTSRRSSTQSDNPYSKIQRDASGCVVIQPKIPKTDIAVNALNDNQISTAQQQLIQLQQQPQIQSSIILNASSNRMRKTQKSLSPNNQQQQQNQLIVQQIPMPQPTNLVQQPQLVTQLASPQNVLQFVTQPIGAQQPHIQQVNEGFILTANPSEDVSVYLFTNDFYGLTLEGNNPNRTKISSYMYILFHIVIDTMFSMPITF